MRVAILVDGGFYRKLSQIKLGDKTPVERADELHQYCMRHLKDNQRTYDLYRILYYDCPPMGKKVFHPLLKRTIDFSKTDLFSWMTEFLNELKKKRKVALRLGKLAEAQAFYTLRYDIIKKLCNGSKNISQIALQRKITAQPPSLRA